MPKAALGYAELGPESVLDAPQYLLDHPSTHITPQQIEAPQVCARHQLARDERRRGPEA